MSGKCPVMHGGNTSTGTSNKEHMMEDLEADKVKLSEDEVNRIESLVAYKSVASRD